MAYQAVITTPERQFALSVEWAGSRDGLETRLAYCRSKGFTPPRGYDAGAGLATLAAVYGNRFGQDSDTYVRLEPYTSDKAMARWGCGTYIIDGWHVTGLMRGGRRVRMEDDGRLGADPAKVARLAEWQPLFGGGWMAKVEGTEASKVRWRPAGEGHGVLDLGSLKLEMTVGARQETIAAMVYVARKRNWPSPTTPEGVACLARLAVDWAGPGNVAIRPGTWKAPKGLESWQIRDWSRLPGLRGRDIVAMNGALPEQEWRLLREPRRPENDSLETVFERVRGCAEITGVQVEHAGVARAPVCASTR